MIYEALAALRAGEGSFSGVNAYVDLQVSFMREVASALAAGEGLESGVDLRVMQEASLCVKLFPH